MFVTAFKRRYSREKNDDDGVFDAEPQVIRKKFPQLNKSTVSSTHSSGLFLNTSTSKPSTELPRDVTHSVENDTEDATAATDGPFMTGTLLYTFDHENQTVATARPIMDHQRSKRDAEAICRDRKYGASSINGYIIEPGGLLQLPCQYW